MTKQEFRTLQEKLKILINHTKKGDFERGIDITLPEYKQALVLLENKILEKLGLSRQEYETLKEEFNRKKPLSYTDLVDTPYIPTIPTKEEIQEMAKEVIPQPVNTTTVVNKIVKEITREKPIINEIKTEKTIEIKDDRVDDMFQDIRTLQLSYQDMLKSIGVTTQFMAGFDGEVTNKIKELVSPEINRIVRSLQSQIYATNKELKDLKSREDDSVEDNRYLKLDQTAPQTVINGAPIFNLGLVMTETTTPATPDSTHAIIWVSDTNGKSNFNLMGSDGLPQRVMRDLISTVRNTTVAIIPRGKLVYQTGSTGTAPNVALAKADSESTMAALGITMEDIAVNGYGRIQRFGRTEFQLDTTMYNEGEELYTSPTTAGEFTNVRPTHPNFPQAIGQVVVKGNGNGSIFTAFTSYYNGHSDGTIKDTWTFGATTATSQILAKTATAQRTATFPNKSGTVAFIDDLTTGYVPYTGANADVNLGTHNILTTGTITGEQITSTDDITMNGYFLNTMSSADTVGFYVDGSTNPSTHIAGQDYSVLKLARGLTGTGTAGTRQIKGFSTSITDDYNFTGGNTITNDATFGISNSLISSKAWTSNNKGSTESFYGVENTILRQGTQSTSLTTNLFGIKGSNQVSTNLIYDGVGKTFTLTSYGGYFSSSINPTLTNGTLTVNNYGISSAVVGSTTGTSTNYGVYTTSTGADTNWLFYADGTTGNNFLGKDNIKTYWGTGFDASIYYNGTDLIIDPKEVGTGVVNLNGGGLTAGAITGTSLTVDTGSSMPTGNNTLITLSGATAFSGGAMSIDWYNENESETMARISVEPGTSYDAPLMKFRISDGAGTLETFLQVSSTGACDFGNNNMTTTGTLSAGAITGTSLTASGFSTNYGVVYNVNDLLTVDAGFTYNDSTDLLTVQKSVTISGGTAITDGFTLTGKIAQTAINGASSEQAGSSDTFVTGNGFATTTPGNTSGIGGNFNVTTGNGANNTLYAFDGEFYAGAAGNAGTFNFQGGTGGNDTSGYSATAGTGGGTVFLGGNGGAVTNSLQYLSESTGGIGGSFSWRGGQGGTMTHSGGNPTNVYGGAGGSFSFTLGVGGFMYDTSPVGTGLARGGDGGSFSVNTSIAGLAYSSTQCIGGGGGTINLNSGSGGSAVPQANGAISTGGDGGIINITSGAGGAVNTDYTGTHTGGNGGNYTFTAGTGGLTQYGTTTVGGNGGVFSFSGGTGGTANQGTGTITGGVGSTMTFTAGAGGSATSRNTGSPTTITGGLAGAITFAGNTGGGGLSQVGTPNVYGGAGSSINFTSGNGGTAGKNSGTPTSCAGGNAGTMTFTAGTGGVGSGGTTNTTGSNGNILFKSGTTEIARFDNNATSSTNTAKAVGSFQIAYLNAVAVDEEAVFINDEMVFLI